MSYQKRIAYVDCYEGGFKIANAGFVRVTERAGVSLQIHISDSSIRELVRGNVCLYRGQAAVPLGQIEIADGKGCLQVEHLEKLLEDAHIEPEKGAELELRIEGVSPGKEYVCKLEAGKNKVEKEEEHPIEVIPPMEKMSDVQESQLVSAETQVATIEKQECEIVKMHPDKWRQLSERYLWVRPFHDERRYLQLELQDLILLPKQYYRLVENSFLLHGYYNYGHLILARVCKRGLDKFYIGVPGNYYEKEKQVAVLFGFESFEPETESPEEGDFGYYMIGVDI